MFKLGVITDEVSQSLETAIQFVQEFDLDGVELRSVNGKGPFAWTTDDVHAMAKLLGENAVEVAAISAPLFKCDIRDEQTVLEHIEGFRRCAQAANILGCKIVRGFDFWESGASLSARARKFREIEKICKEYDIVCALEYDPSVHSNTPEKLRAMVDAIASSRIRAVFDPGNGVFSSPQRLPIPADYETMRDVLCHMHIKDAVPEGDSARAVCIGQGVVDYPALFDLLRRDGYEGYLILETHYRLTGELSEDQLKLPGGVDFSDGAWPASAESMAAMQNILFAAK